MRFYSRVAPVPAPGTVQGYLVVSVTTASGVLPLLDACVTVSRDAVVLRHSACGDPVPQLKVSAPLVLSTGDERKCTLLAVEVSLEGYRAVKRTGIEVYPGCTGYLQVDLVPLAGAEHTYPLAGAGCGDIFAGAGCGDIFAGAGCGTAASDGYYIAGRTGTVQQAAQ